MARDNSISGEMRTLAYNTAFGLINDTADAKRIHDAAGEDTPATVVANARSIINSSVMVGDERITASSVRRELAEFQKKTSAPPVGDPDQ